MNRIQLPRARFALLGAVAALSTCGGLALAQIEAQSIIVVGQQTWLEKADLNGDGLLNYNEWRRAAFNWFVDVDANGDDVIDAAEYERAARADAVPAGELTARRNAFFAQVDSDRNGKIGYYEFARAMRARFDAVDRERDGKIGPNNLREAGQENHSFTQVISPLPKRR